MEQFIPLKDACHEETVFPKLWQAVIYRNYGKIPTVRIAEVLQMESGEVEKHARLLGLGKVAFSNVWLEKGYLQIIRDNWKILSYNQLLRLLDMDEKRLEQIYKDEDFFYAKLGIAKPQFEDTVYEDLDENEYARTIRLGLEIANLGLEKHKAFDFGYAAPVKEFSEGETAVENRFIYGYETSCGYDFWEGSDGVSDELLAALSQRGINGLWIHAIFHQLVGYPFEAAYGKDCEKRISRLNELIERARAYGIKIYLYVNEPRCMPKTFFEKHGKLLGFYRGNTGSLCTSLQEVKDYVVYAAKTICEKVPEIGGFISITMSENLTHCRSKGGCQCDRCKNRSLAEMVAEINNLIYKGIRLANGKAELIAWTWAWAAELGFDKNEFYRAVELTDTGISVMSTSEDGLLVDGRALGDYSIAHVGPSEKTKNILRYAKDKGHKTVLKMQLSNSWECPVVPYLPVFPLQYEHMKRILPLQPNGLMLSWTMGAYPSPVLDLTSRFFNGNVPSLQEWYDDYYGEYGEEMSQICATFAKAFENNPCNTMFMYIGPVSRGLAEPLYIKPQKENSTMIGYLYDDWRRWISDYPQDKLERDLKKMIAEWQQGVVKLEDLVATAKQSERYAALAETLDMAKAALCAYQSEYHHLLFSVKKETGQIDKEIMRKEAGAVRTFLEIALRDGRLGFEAANHYLFCPRNLGEKWLTLQEYIRKE